MSENPVTFQAQPKDQSVQPSPVENAQGTQQANESQSDPKNEIRQIVKEVMSSEFENLKRHEQSQRDKFENRIKSDVQKQIDTMTKLGVQVTDEMKQNIENVTRENVAQEYQSENSQDQNGQSDNTGDKGSIDPIVQSAMAEVAEFEKQFGFELLESDPEAQQVDQSTPFKFVKSYEKAMQAKSDRLAKEGKAPKNPMAGVHTSIGSSTPGNPLAGMNPMDKFSKAYNERK